MASERVVGPRPLRAVAARVDRSRERALGLHTTPTAASATAQVRTDVAVVVVAVGVLCTVVAWRVAPTSTATTSDVAQSWCALLTGTLFWAGACIGAIGLFLRLRRGVLGALVCALSVLAAVVLDAVLDSSVVGVRWGIQLACASAFVLTAASALVVSGPGRSARA